MDFGSHLGLRREKCAFIVLFTQLEPFSKQAQAIDFIDLFLIDGVGWGVHPCTVRYFGGFTSFASSEKLIASWFWGRGDYTAEGLMKWTKTMPEESRKGSVGW